MKKIILVSSLVASLCSAPIFAANFENTFMQKWTAIYPTLKAQAPNLWPGFQINETHPSLFYFNVLQHTYALDFTPKNQAWKKITISNTPVEYLETDSLGIGSFEPGLTQPYLQLDGQATLVFHPIDFSNGQALDDVTDFNVKIAIENDYNLYELFESPYAKSKIALGLKNITYSGFRQIDNTSLLYLEARILKEYLSTFDVDLLKDFAAVEATRTQQNDADTNNFEQAQAPFMEEYVSSRALSKDDASYAKLALLDFPDLEMNPGVSSPDAYFIFLNFMQDVVGLGLDKVNPGWKATVEAENVAPNKLLEQTFNLSKDEITKRVATSKNQFNYAEIYSAVSSTFQPYNQQLTNLQQAYLADSGVPFQINMGDDYGLSGSYDKVYHVDSASNLYAAGYFLVKNLALHLRVSANKMPVTYQEITYQDTSDPLTSFTIKLAPETKLTIDGTTTTVAKFIATGKEATAHQVLVVNPAANVDIFDYGQGFVLSSKDGKIQLSSLDETSSVKTYINKRSMYKIHNNNLKAKKR